MKQKTYTLISGLVFVAIAILHALRSALSWEAEINGLKMPLWLSWIAIIVAAYLAYVAFGLIRKLK